ncbi:MAG TPA: STAS domain-containing protein [Bryobacteraceae bacterium]|nr:STAS domain-containing protein [Bryobacteraceae bacterium]
MSLSLTTRNEGDVTVISAIGRITLGPGSGALRDTLQQVSAAGNPKIVINLSGVSAMDSAGLGELVSGFTTARSRGGVLKLAALPKRVEELLRMTGIYRIFEVHHDEARAIRSFG